MVAVLAVLSAGSGAAAAGAGASGTGSGVACSSSSGSLGASAGALSSRRQGRSPRKWRNLIGLRLSRRLYWSVAVPGRLRGCCTTARVRSAIVSPDSPQVQEQAERWRVLADLEEWLEKPMLFLGAVWLCLVLVELIWTTSRVFEFVGTAIWLIFLAEFALRLALAPDKLRFLRGNLITVIALIAPAFRFLRVFRLLRVARGVRLVRIVGTANRGINLLRGRFTRRGVGYVLGATTLVALLGAAGMLGFEPAAEIDGGFAGYADALWWTAMLISTMGSGYWPQTAEGRLLTLLLSFYGLAVFGYITASFASFLIGQEARAADGVAAGSGDLAMLRNEIAQLRAEVQRLAGRHDPAT